MGNSIRDEDTCISYLDGDERQWFRLEEVLEQLVLADERHGIGEIAVKEGEQRRRRVQSLELGEGHEQRHGPGAVLVGQRDHHELSARPDVQEGVGHGELATHQCTTVVMFKNRSYTHQVEIKPNGNIRRKFFRKFLFYFLS